MEWSRRAKRSVWGLLLGLVGAQAQTYTDAFPGISLTKPVWFGEIPGKPEHFLVLEQHLGNVTLLRKEGTAWVKAPFWNVSVNTSNEMGLLGFAFHPQFASNRKYYVNYNPASGGSATVIEERTADTSFLKDAGTTRQILRITQPYANHNGGSIGFGPKDGFLYIGMGDGGSQNDPEGNGQNKNVLLAKMLRIDVNGVSTGKQYAIPSDNPFATSGGAPEVFAWGLRNPWKWSFDPVTGNLWVADVGQGAQEEVDIVVKNGNYGWDISEGYANVGAGMTRPVFAYPRADGSSVTGGFVFRGAPSSKYYGKFIVADFNTRKVWALQAAAAGDSAAVEALAAAPNAPSSFGTDSRGHLYVLGHANGKIYRFDGPDWAPATVRVLPDQGYIKQGIGCIFACRRGSPLSLAAFEAGRELGIFSLSGKRAGSVSRAAPEVPSTLKPGIYLLRAGQEKANLLMVE